MSSCGTRGWQQVTLNKRHPSRILSALEVVYEKESCFAQLLLRSQNVPVSRIPWYSVFCRKALILIDLDMFSKLTLDVYILLKLRRTGLKGENSFARVTLSVVGVGVSTFAFLQCPHFIRGC